MKTKITVCIAVFGAVLLGERLEIGAGQVPDNMVWIPPGTFMMGSPETEQDRWISETLHQVTISHGFYMSKYEVTQREYLSIMGNNPAYFEGDLKRPVERVSWFDATNYCWNLTRFEKIAGRLPAGYVYRLPTEAEWEYACRAGTTTRFSYGDDPDYSQLTYYSWNRRNNFTLTKPEGTSLYIENKYYTTHPVGTKLPNPWGFYDMHGNVGEWCMDWIDVYPKGNVVDPLMSEQGFVGWRIIRGDNLYAPITQYRSAARIYDFPVRNTLLFVGFRPVLAWNSVSFSSWATDVFGNVPKVVQPTYSEPPKKEAGKDSLVVVTHGWNPDVKWLDEMTNTITTYLVAKGLNNWQVHAHKWVEKANASLLQVLQEAEKEGKNLGNSIASKEWEHVHLIAHSAGAALIQAATEKIKDKWKNTTVHLTFLDPYVGVVYDGRNKYGNRADWADNYFTRDLETSGETFTLTEGALKKAYDVDVTFLDKSKTKKDVYYSSSGSVIQQCQEATTTHGWPHEFYAQTILPSVLSGAENFGFPLSREGGNWDFATNTYTIDEKSSYIKVLGTRDPSCLPSLYETTPAYIGDQMNFSTTPSTASTTGVVQKNDFGLNLVSVVSGLKLQSLAAVAPSTGPAWLASTITITNAVNLLSFKTAFLSGAGAEGLLSVYWETNVIGTIDERVASSGIHQYIFPIPKVTNGTQTLGFRLDSFSLIASSVTITNVALGFAGVKEPFSLSFAGSQPDGLPILQLTGQRDFNYTVETSTNLVDWKVFAILVNTNGVVRFNTTPNNAIARFYRAVAP